MLFHFERLRLIWFSAAVFYFYQRILGIIFPHAPLMNAVGIDVSKGKSTDSEPVHSLVSPAILQLYTLNETLASFPVSLKEIGFVKR